MLRYNANEVAKVTAALRHLLRQKKGAAGATKYATPIGKGLLLL